MFIHLILLFIILSLILFNLGFKFYSSLNHMSGYLLVSLILYLFHMLVTLFRIFFFLTLHIYLLVSSVLHVHSHCTAFPNQKVCHLVWLSRNPMPWCCIHISSVDIFHLLPLFFKIFQFFVNYLNIPLCLAIALLFYFHSSNLS